MDNGSPNSSFFKTFVHQCNDLVVITDNQARVVYVNPAFEKHTGYSLKKISRKNISFIKSGLHNNTFYKNLWKKLKAGKPSSVIFINKKKNGELYYENKTITPIIGRNKEIKYYLSTSKDVTTEITKTRAIQHSLEESQKVAKIGTWEWDIASNNVYWSDEIYRIFEVDQKKFKPSYLNFLGVIYPEDREKVENALNNSLSNKMPYEVIHRVKVGSGKIKFVRENGFASYSKSGKPLKMVGTVLDITSERQLREDLQSAYVTLQNSLNSVFTCDLEGRILFANKAAAKMWGFRSINEMLSARPLIAMYWDKKHTSEISRVIALVLKKDYYYSNTAFTAIRKSGEIMMVKFNLSVIKDEQNVTRGITGAFFDITEQLRIERKIKAYDEKINLMLGNIDEVVFGIDANNGSLTAGNVFYLSAKSKELMGFTLDDLRGHPDLWNSLIHPGDFELVFQSNLQCVKTRSTVTRIYRLRHYKTGQFRWFEEKITPYETEDLTFYGSSRDVTDRILSEKRLKENEEKYRSIFENALVGIFRTNLQTQKALDANEVCIDMFGYESKEDFLNNFIAANHYMSNEERSALFNNIDLQNPIRNQKMKFKRKDGTVFWGDTSAKLLNNDGVLEGVLVDVTESHEYEEKLKKNIREKEILLKEVHHRVKNNLQVISSLLKLQLNKLDNEALRHPLIESYERIRAIALIHEKLYLSHDMATINFSDYLLNLTKSTLSFYSEKGVKLSFELNQFETDINVAIPLGLMCYEIVSNAFKHAFAEPEGKELKVQISTPPEFAFITISDTGKGFDVRQLNNTNTLGWKLIKNLAVQAKALVDVNSEPGKGTSIKITLPHEGA